MGLGHRGTYRDLKRVPLKETDGNVIICIQFTLKSETKKGAYVWNIIHITEVIQPVITTDVIKQLVTLKKDSKK